MDFTTLVDVTIELFNMDNRQLGELQVFLQNLIGDKFRKEVRFLMDKNFFNDNDKEIIHTKNLVVAGEEELDDIVDLSKLSKEDNLHNQQYCEKNEELNLNKIVKEILASEEIMEEINIEGIIERRLTDSSLLIELKGLKIELEELKKELINQKEDFIERAVKKVKEEEFSKVDQQLTKKQEVIKKNNHQKNHLKGGEKTMEEKEQIETRGCRCEKEDAEVEQILPACEEQLIPFCCTLLVPAGFNVTEDLIMSNFELAATPVTGCFECRTDDCECGPIVANQVSIKGTIKFIADVFGVTGDGLGGFAAICCSDVICIPDFVPVCAACNANCTDLRIDGVDVTSATQIGTSCNGDETWEVRGEISFAC